MLQEIIKPFKIIAIVIAIEFIFLFSFFTAMYSSYDKNLFTITLNDIEMSCYYSEKYTSGVFTHATSSGYNAVENRVNSIDLKDTMNLKVEEYEVYYKNGQRKQNTNGWYKDDSLVYKKVNNSNLRLQIKRKNSIIYEGKYIEDLSTILKEKGRYFIHIYSTKNNHLFSSVKTHISFNVVVGGGNRE